MLHFAPTYTTYNTEKCDLCPVVGEGDSVVFPPVLVSSAVKVGTNCNSIPIYVWISSEKNQDKQADCCMIRSQFK